MKYKNIVIIGGLLIALIVTVILGNIRYGKMHMQLEELRAASGLSPKSVLTVNKKVVQQINKTTKDILKELGYVEPVKSSTNEDNKKDSTSNESITNASKNETNDEQKSE